MPTLSVQSKRLAHFDKRNLPSNSHEVIGAGRIGVIDYFATLGGFFKTALYGPVDNWSKFWQSVSSRASSNRKQKSLELYDSIKGGAQSLVIGRKFVSEKEMQEAQKAKDLRRKQRSFEVLSTSMSDKSVSEILKALLASKSDADVMISLKQLAKDSRISREVRKEINQRLNAARKNKKYIEYIPENPNYYRYLWTKRAAMIIGIGIILGIGVASSFKVFGQPIIAETESEIPLPTPPLDTQPKVFQWLVNQMNQSLSDAKYIVNQIPAAFQRAAESVATAGKALVNKEDQNSQKLLNMTNETPEWIQNGLNSVKQGSQNLWAMYMSNAREVCQDARDMPKRVLLLLPSSEHSNTDTLDATKQMLERGFSMIITSAQKVSLDAIRQIFKRA